MTADDLSQRVEALAAACRTGQPSVELVQTVLDALGSDSSPAETWSGEPGALASVCDALLEGAPAGPIAEALQSWLDTRYGVERYRIERVLGRGGMGEVVEATDLQLDRPVALKFLAARAPRSLRLRFDREARITARLTHPNVVPVHDSGESSDGRAFISMKAVDGRSLGEIVAARDIGVRDRLRIFDKVCDAMAYAHAQGVVHRDLKPDNIMVGAFGEVLVMDWGLAREGTDDLPTLESNSSSPGLTRTGQIMGTPSYMAPEQARGESASVGPSADVYALGAVLFALITGRPPLEGDDVQAIVGRVASGAVPSPRTVAPGVSKELDAIVRKAMSLAPEDRYPGVHALQADVQAYLAREPVSVVRYSWSDGVVRWVGRHRASLSAGGSVALVAAGLLGGVVLGFAGLGAYGLWRYVSDLEEEAQTTRSALFRQLLSEGSALGEVGRHTEAHTRYAEALELAESQDHLDALPARLARALARIEAPDGWTFDRQIIGVHADHMLVFDDEGFAWRDLATGAVLSERPHGEQVWPWGRVEVEPGGLVEVPVRGARRFVAVELPTDARLTEWFPDAQMGVAVRGKETLVWRPGQAWSPIRSGLGKIRPLGDGWVGLNDWVYAGDRTGPTWDQWGWRLAARGGEVVVGDHDELWMVGADGTTRWTRPAPGLSYLSTVGDEIGLFLGGQRVEVLSADGERRSVIGLGEHRSGHLTAAAVVIGLQDGGRVVPRAYRPSTEGSVRASSVHPDGLMVLGGAHRVRLVDAVTGVSLWSRFSADEVYDVSFDVERGLVWVAGREGALRGLDVASGSEAREFDLFVAVTSVRVWDRRLYVTLAGDAPQVAEIDPDDGAVIRSVAVRGNAPWELVVTPDGLVTGPQNGPFRVFGPDLEERRVLERETNGDLFGGDHRFGQTVFVGVHELMVDDGKEARTCELPARMMDVRWVAPGWVVATGLDPRLWIIDVERCEIAHSVHLDRLHPSLGIHDGLLWLVGPELQRVDLEDPDPLADAVAQAGAGDFDRARRAYLRVGALEMAARLPNARSVDGARAALILGPEATAAALPQSQQGPWAEAVRAWIARGGAL